MTDPRLLKDIKTAEACKLTAYKDSLGIWTIGYGHELFPQTKDWTGHTWTQEQADGQLELDIADAETFARGTTEFAFCDTDCRRNALIELSFNMKRRWLLFGNCRAAIRAHDWKTAHDQLLSSLWAAQVHATRANRLADYLFTGEYPA